jgi:hypothetical protein
VIEWRSVLDGFYEVSSDGQVRRARAASNAKVGKVLRAQLNRCGYFVVGVCMNGKKRLIPVHSLVAGAFLGPRPDGMHIDHIDGCKVHNAASNLEYVTPKINTIRAHKLGLAAVHDRHPQAKLTSDQAARLYQIMQSAHNKSHLAKEYGISRRALRFIQQGRTWSSKQERR